MVSVSAQHDYPDNYYRPSRDVPRMIAHVTEALSRYNINISTDECHRKAGEKPL